jgi:NADPH:quinone reductase-like Zn-dependent oxidoreductase
MRDETALRCRPLFSTVGETAIVTDTVYTSLKRRDSPKSPHTAGISMVLLSSARPCRARALPDTLLAMKAIVITRLGGPEVLEFRHVPEPVAGPGKVLVRVEAGGLNFADLMTAQGGYPGTPKPPLVAGREFAGVEEAAGRRVMGYTQWAAFAEKTVVNPELLWPVPQGWSTEQAAAFPVNYFTGYFAYWEAGFLTEANRGKRVLIHAVAGGVGTAAVQIGKILGAEMYGTSSSEDKLARVKELGLQHAINYKERDYEEAVKDLTQGEGVDAVFEMLGGEHTAKSIRCLRDFGKVVQYGTATGKKPELDLRALYAKAASVQGLWLTYLSSKRDLMDQAWKQLSAWVAEGKIHPVVGHVLPAQQAAEGYRLLMERKNFGKVVLKIA